MGARYSSMHSQIIKTDRETENGGHHHVSRADGRPWNSIHLEIEFLRKRAFAAGPGVARGTSSVSNGQMSTKNPRKSAIFLP